MVLTCFNCINHGFSPGFPGFFLPSPGAEQFPQASTRTKPSCCCEAAPGTWPSSTRRASSTDFSGIPEEGGLVGHGVTLMIIDMVYGAEQFLCPFPLVFSMYPLVN